MATSDVEAAGAGHLPTLFPAMSERRQSQRLSPAAERRSCWVGAERSRPRRHRRPISPLTRPHVDALSAIAEQSTPRKSVRIPSIRTGRPVCAMLACWITPRKAASARDWKEPLPVSFSAGQTIPKDHIPPSRIEFGIDSDRGSVMAHGTLARSHRLVPHRGGKARRVPRCAAQVQRENGNSDSGERASDPAGGLRSIFVLLWREAPAAGRMAQ